MSMSFRDYVDEVAHAIRHLDPKYPIEAYYSIRQLRYNWKCHLGLHYWKKGVYANWRTGEDGYNEPLAHGWHCQNYCHDNVPLGKFPYAPIRYRVFWSLIDRPYTWWWNFREWIAERNS